MLLHRLLPLAFAALLLSSCCDDDCDDDVVAAEPRPVSILVEVYDPVTNLVWENVSVRVVEADQEWSNCSCTSPVETWFLTDVTGRVLLDEYLLAAADVGFLEDGNGRAVLGPHAAEDEATVLIEVDAVGFTPVRVAVPLRWDRPDVFVEVPFN
jgi:hypothetical protein